MTLRLTFEMNSPEEVEQILNLVYPNRVTTAPVLATVPAAPVPPQAGTEGLAAPATPVASAAVLELLRANNLDGSEITGTGKQGRLTKADVTAYLKTIAPPAPVEPDPFALDDASPAPVATKEQVRTALIGYQTAYRDSLIAAGKPEEEAKTTAMNAARGLLGTAGGGATTLGALTEAQYGAVVLAATAAVNALAGG